MKNPLLYPKRTPDEEGYLSVGQNHCLYYQRHGDRDKYPVVYLHGGPGGGCSFEEYRYFDPDHYCVILFDQRGAGKSLPYAETRHNTPNDLIADLEKLRYHFGFKKWAIYGGSWGSSLAMLYALAHPQRVTRMILRGIFFADYRGACYITEENGAAKTYKNIYYADYRDFCLKYHPDSSTLLHSLYKCVFDDNQKTALKAAKLFDLWDTSIAFYDNADKHLQAIAQNPQNSLALARIFTHYACNFYSEDMRYYLLNGMASFTHRVDILHGQQDYICPLENATTLHGVLRNSHLYIVDKCGHSQTEPLLQNALIKITDQRKSEENDVI